MKIAVLAIGRLKAGPERDLFDRYRDRADKAGRRLGLTVDCREFAESRAAEPSARKSDEARLLAGAAGGIPRVALDEHGKSLDSRGLADRIAAWRDGGAPGLAFAIGGPDGLDPAFLDQAELRLAFGAMTWPHQLVRVMLMEQIYRAVTILSGHPYHRD